MTLGGSVEATVNERTAQVWGRGDVVEGTPFGRYRLLELLGQGGMGEVWRVYDTEIDRVVALKMLLPSFAQDHVYEQRFRREARVAARLDDPHVVPIYDVGEIDGRLYLTMRLIKGVDLQTLVDSGPLEPERALRIIEQVASALNDAHEAGLVHRDVKPSNVLLGDDDFAYLIDFGIASAAGESGLTNTGTTIGTWSYMAPERFSAGQVERASDVYALTCVLYQCLTGYLPYPGNTLEQIAMAHMVAPPPQPSIARPGLPPDVDYVIAKGLAKSPDARYATTKDLVRDARAALTAAAPGVPPTALNALAGPQLRHHLTAASPTWQGPVSPLVTPQPPRRSSGKVIAILAAAGCVLLVAIIAIVFVTTRDTKPVVSQADRTSTTASSAAPPVTTTTTTTTTRPPPDINTLMLNVGDTNAIVGTTNLSLYRSGEAPEADTGSVTPPECHAASAVRGVAEYGSSGFVAMRWQTMLTPGSRGVAIDSVAQLVAQYPSPTVASAFIENLTPLLEACRSKTVTSTDTASGSTAQGVIEAVTTGPNEVSVTTRYLGKNAGLFCQVSHRAASIFVIETSVCGSNIGDTTVRMAQAIATRIETA